MKSIEEILDKHVLSHDKGKGLVIMNDTFKVSVLNAIKEAQKEALHEVVKRKWDNMTSNWKNGSFQTIDDIVLELIKEIEG